MNTVHHREYAFMAINLLVFIGKVYDHMMLGNKGYLSANVQKNLFETVNILLRFRIS